MQILRSQLNEHSLARFGEQAKSLLLAGDYQSLANEFGYALAYGREPANAIMEDYALRQRECEEQQKNVIAARKPITVKFFKPNSIGLLALVECVIPTNINNYVLLELVAAGNDQEIHLYLEDISAIV